MQDFGKFSDPKTKSEHSDPRNVGIYMLISNVEICPDKEIQITIGLWDQPSYSLGLGASDRILGPCHD